MTKHKPNIKSECQNKNQNTEKESGGVFDQISVFTLVGILSFLVDLLFNDLLDILKTIGDLSLFDI